MVAVTAAPIRMPTPIKISRSGDMGPLRRGESPAWLAAGASGYLITRSRGDSRPQRNHRVGHFSKAERSADLREEVGEYPDDERVTGVEMAVRILLGALDLLEDVQARREEGQDYRDEDDQRKDCEVAAGRFDPTQ